MTLTIRSTAFAAAVGWLLVAGLPAPSQAGDLQVSVHKGGFATVNSFIFSNGKSQIVMDVQRKPDEAQRVVELVKSKGLPLTHIFISHGHTDHFTGMEVFRRAFPDAQIVVASAEIKKDVTAYAVYMDSGGETGAEPALDRSIKPRSADHPDGFDYENWIHVLPGRTLTLDGGGTLEITADYPPTEAPYMATVYSKDLNALFLADLGYNKVHLWMGDDISLERVARWRAVLGELKERYRDLEPKVYPGHGDPTDMSMFDAMIGYIDDYTRIVSQAGSREEAMAQMKARYPDYKEADFFLKYSLENHMK
jgi:glyoxylase-like metal-dependent hydrolase (beta-lactamase superfamily II)